MGPQKQTEVLQNLGEYMEPRPECWQHVVVELDQLKKGMQQSLSVHRVLQPSGKICADYVSSRNDQDPVDPGDGRHTRGIVPSRRNDRIDEWLAVHRVLFKIDRQ